MHPAKLPSAALCLSFHSTGVSCGRSPHTSLHPLPSYDVFLSSAGTFSQWEHSGVDQLFVLGMCLVSTRNMSFFGAQRHGQSLWNNWEAMWNVENLPRKMVKYPTDSMSEHVREESVGELAIQLALDYAKGMSRMEAVNGSSDHNLDDWKRAECIDSPLIRGANGQSSIENLRKLLASKVSGAAFNKESQSKHSFANNGPTNYNAGSSGKIFPPQNGTKLQRSNGLVAGLTKSSNNPLFDRTTLLLNKRSMGDCPTGSWVTTGGKQRIPTGTAQLQQFDTANDFSSTWKMRMRESDTDSDDSIACVQPQFLRRYVTTSSSGDKMDNAMNIRTKEQRGRHHRSHCKEYCGSSGGSSSSRGSSRVKYTECVFCKTNGETATMYRSHVLKDEYGRTVCQVLQKYICPLCGATGSNAHTVKYCPRNANPPPVATMTTLKSMRSSTGRKRQGACSSQALKFSNNGSLLSHLY